MRSDLATALLGLVICAVTSATPMYSCFDPPAVEGQTSPLGEGLEHLVEAECCEALIHEGDILAGRLVVWDPINCNHGPSDPAIAEAFLCRAYDTDGCRFCHLSCSGYEGLCITCLEIFSATTSPTPIPTGLSYPTSGTTEAPLETPAPFDAFPEVPSPTPAPILPSTPAPTPAPIVDGGNESDCECLQNMTDTEADVLAIRGKTMRCDPTCSNNEDLVWGVLNCNYFALGQDCRTCADTCEEQSEGVWLDQYLAFCKPCSAIP